MGNSYFTLSDSEGTTKKFAVLHTGYEPVIEKSQTVQKTINGGLDIAFGGLYEMHTYTIRIRETETRPDYGSKADLEAFFRLNDPNGTPTPKLTLNDHFGIDHDVYMTGNFAPTPLGVMIEGDQAWMIVKCTFQFSTAAQGSGS